MTSQGIKGSVNRVFRSVGIIFIFGGVFFGSILYLTAPEVVQKQALIEEVSVEKRRPFGFEDIPIDSEDPDHAHIPVYTDVTATVRYELNGATFTSEISSPVDDPGWSKNDYIPVYIVSDQPQYPLPYFPKDAGNQKKYALLAGFGLLLMGTALLVVSIFDRRRDRRQHQELIEELEQAGITPKATGEVQPDEPILHTASFRGGWFTGGILAAIGAVMAIAAGSQLLGNSAMESLDRLMLLFPVAAGVLLVFTAIPDFNRTRVEVRPSGIRVKQRSLFTTRVIDEPMSHFYGLHESITQVQRPHRVQRYFYREYSPIHKDPALSALTIFKIPDTSDAWGKLKEFSELTGLPIISEDNGELSIIAPHESSAKTAESERAALQPTGISDSQPFPAKHLRLQQDDADGFTVTRSYKKALYWGIGILVIGIIGSIAAKSAIIMVPLGMMGLIFIGISGKFDYFSVESGKIQFEERVYGFLYSETTIPCRKIERIAIDSDPRRHMATSLVIQSQDERITFGQSAGQEELEWIADRLKRECTHNS